MRPAGNPRIPRAATIVAAAVSVGGGMILAVRDAGASYDDTGVTAVGLVLVATIAAFVAGARPWIWALATGIWVPVLELRAITSSGPIAALAFSALGATAGYLIARAR